MQHVHVDIVLYVYWSTSSRVTYPHDASGLSWAAEDVKAAVASLEELKIKDFIFKMGNY